MINLANRAAKQREAARQLRLSLTLERGAERRLRAEFGRVAQQVSVHVQHHGRDPGAFHAQHEANLRVILVSYYRQCIHAFYERARSAAPKAMALAGGRVEHKDAPDVPDLETLIRQFIREWGGTRVVGIARTTSDRIAKALEQSAADSLTNEETAKRIVHAVGGEIAIERARTIARTEAHTSAMYGSEQGARASGADIRRKEWVATGDARTRDDHAAADGQIVGIDEDFDVGGEALAFPGDPSGSPENTINCRCIMTYGTGEE